MIIIMHVPASCEERDYKVLKIYARPFVPSSVRS